MRYFTLFILLITAVLQSCNAQDDNKGNVAQQSAQARPDVERDSVKKIEIHYACDSVKAEKYYEKGKATYYSAKAHGRRTANGEKHDKNAMICAHKKLPFGTLIRVVNENNKKEVVVRVNDRGPFGKGMVIDLSIGAAKQLGMLAAGVVPVTLYVVE